MYVRLEKSVDELMNIKTDVIIAGGGLGGACAALWLSESRKVTLLSGTTPATSLVAAGLVNPFSGQRMGGLQNAETIYKDLIQTLTRADALNTYDSCGILRPAINDAQASRFYTLALDAPHSFTWLSSNHMRQNYPGIAAPLGAMITTGGVVDTPKMLQCIFSALPPHCKIIHTNLCNWKDNDTDVVVQLDTAESIRTKKLILAVGASYPSIPKLAHLNLHRTKGQIVQVSLPENNPVPLPISGYGYAVPIHNHLLLGTTYEHDPRDAAPSREGIMKILALTQKMIPWVKSAKILRASAGIRVGVPQTRMPMVGPLSKNTWILTGLGSKGLLFSSYVGRNLTNWIADPASIPENFRVRKISGVFTSI